MKISVIIVSWNVRDFLKKCLESVFEFTKNVSFEIIVVDNNSQDGTIEMIKQNYHQVKLIGLDENVGFAAANNIVIRQANGEYVLLLNPDTAFIENSFAKIFSEIDPNNFI